MIRGQFFYYQENEVTKLKGGRRPVGGCTRHHPLLLFNFIEILQRANVKFLQGLAAFSIRI